MKKRILSALLALMLCMSLTLAVSAEPKAIDFVIDECGYLADAEITILNEQALDIYKETGVGIFFVFTQAASVDEYDIDSIVNGITDYVVMVENDTHWIVYKRGAGEIIGDAEAEALRGVYDETATYVEGVDAFLNAAADYFPRISDAPETIAPELAGGFLFDEANLLSDSEEADLMEKLAQVSGDYNAQIVVYTIGSMNGGNIDSFVDYLYDSQNYGYGANRDGVLLLVCMDPREYRILSNGYAGVAIDPDAISNIGEAIVSDLSDGNYADAFHGFADECVYYLDGYLNGFPFNAGKSMLISLVIGVAAGVIVAFVLKGQLKSVHKQDRAHVYVKSDSMKVTVSNDIFLYRDVTRTKKESSNSSNSGSGGGSARSKGGGSF